MENHIKIDDLGVPLFLETPTSIGNWSWSSLPPAFPARGPAGKAAGHVDFGDLCRQPFF